jgi:hypothetical protein
MPQTAAATEAAMDAQGTRSVQGRQVVTISLTFDSGQTWNPGAFYDALNTLYGTVSNMNDAIGNNFDYNLLISA